MSDTLSTTMSTISTTAVSPSRRKVYTRYDWLREEDGPVVVSDSEDEHRSDYALPSLRVASSSESASTQRFSTSSSITSDPPKIISKMLDEPRWSSSSSDTGATGTTTTTSKADSSDFPPRDPLASCLRKTTNTTAQSVVSEPGYQSQAYRTLLRQRQSAVRSTASVTPQLPADVLVRVSGAPDQSFSHSSHILAYASTVLAQHLEPITDNGPYSYRLALDASVQEWVLVQAFLQPHAVQVATVTPEHLPTVLPWFHQLRWTVLLSECDVLLRSLEWPLPPNASVDRSFSTTSSSTAHNKETTVLPQDILDCMVLARIASKADLKGTLQSCLNLLTSYLDEIPSLFAEQLDVIKALCEVLTDPGCRKHLWFTIISYLPEDMPVLDNKEGLVSNPLFPYLLREGLERAHRKLRRKTILSSTNVEDSIDEIERYLDEQVHSKSERTTRSTETDRPLENSFAAWWWSSMRRSGPSPSSTTRATHRKAVQGVNRTAWLERIWRSLQRPALVQAHADGPVSPVFPARPRRTFAC